MHGHAFDRQAVIDGIRRIAPLSVPGLPFGLVLGLIIRDGGIDALAGWSSSWLIFAGAAQLAALSLLAEDASAAVIIVTVLFINSRHAMYSAALKARFADLPTWFRILGPYLLLDQLFAITESTSELETSTGRYRLWHYLGAGAFIWLVWQLAVALGVFVGDIVDEDWSLTFAVPLLFGGLLILAVKDRPGIVAAVVASIVALLGRELPQGSGLLLAIIVGVAAAGVAERFLSERETQ